MKKHQTQAGKTVWGDKLRATVSDLPLIFCVITEDLIYLIFYVIKVVARVSELLTERLITNN